MFKDNLQNSHLLSEFEDLGLLAHLKSLMLSVPSGLTKGTLAEITLSDSEGRAIWPTEWLSGTQSDEDFVGIYGDFEVTMSLTQLFALWVKELNSVNSDLNVQLTGSSPDLPDTLLTAKQVSQYYSKVPTIQFYGFDAKGRHLEVSGYGLFDPEEGSRFDNHCS